MRRDYEDEDRFDIEEVINALNSKDTGFLFANGRKKRTLMKILNTKEFHEWLWNPNTDEKNLAGSVEALYTEFSMISNLERLEKVLASADKEDFKYPRGVVTFATSVSAFASEVAPIAINNAKADMNEGKMSKKAYLEEREKGELILELADDVTKAARDLVDFDASRLSNKTGLPKKFCKIALCSCPEPTFIPKFRLGQWLYNLLAELYAMAENEPERFSKGYYGSTPKYNWNRFFATLFGEDNVVECSSYIILEGIKRISTYKSDKVEMVWKSLTAFALENLEEAPSGVREHMLELYIKRLDAMFANGTFDTRVNLLELDKREYPELMKSVDKYSDKIRTIIGDRKRK